jgi:hypothetical protein
MSRANIYAINQTGAIRRVAIGIRILSLIFLIGGIASFYFGRTDLAGFVGLVVLCIIMNVIPSVPLLAALRRFRHTQALDRLVTWEITDEQLTVKSDLASMTLRWNALIRVVRLPDGFLLGTDPGFFQWLPTHAFHEPPDIERFAELAKSKVRRYDLAK